MPSGETAGWRLIDSGSGTAAWNMAVDEALLLRAAGGLCGPALRYFSWETPSLSIGSFQKVELLDMDEIIRRGLPLVRRPTGGRAVLHDAELTYSVVCPIPSPHLPSDLMGSYSTIGSCFMDGLKRLGADVSLVPVKRGPDRKKGVADGRDPLCFSSPSWHEVLANGRKLVGSAQRRMKGAFLQQGSLLVRLDVEGLAALLRFPDDSARDDAVRALRARMTALSELGISPSPAELKAAVAAGFEKVLGTNMLPGTLTLEEQELASRLCRDKYETDGWNIMRQASM